ncbi:MAG: hypothetical protein R3F49_25160 [Planctomycetota bacterium]
MSLRAQNCVGQVDLGTFGFGDSVAYGVSADGSVVVGYASVAVPALITSGAFRWTAAGGMQNIGTLGHPFATSTANGVSADGSVVVGTSGDRAFRWTATGGMQDLGTLGGSDSLANGVSADGTFVVGRADLANGEQHAFLWTQVGGMQDLGTLPGSVLSEAFDVSADGSVVVGTSVSQGSAARAFLWTAGGGIVDLGTLGGLNSLGRALSDDGSVVVGCAEDATGVLHGFLWTQAGGMTDLGGGLLAHGVSADGSVVVGELTGGGLPSAFKWTEATGAQELGPLVGFFSRAHDTSANGTVVVGMTPAPGSAAHAFRLQSSVLGDTYCRPTVPNSSGCGGIVLAIGDPRLATGALELTATLLPPNSFGFFLTSQAQDLVVAAGGSQGNLCLGGAIGRFVGPGQVMNSGASGTFTMAVDLNAIPAPTLSGSVAAQPGDTWNFQAWHRDANPTRTSNFTDAVSVLFQ